MRNGNTPKSGRPANGTAAFRTFKRTVERYGLVRPGDQVLVACSGGPDSVALVHLLLQLRPDLPHEVAVGHFNHRLRPAAAGDEAFVRNLARANGLPFFSSRRDVRAYAQRFGLNLEEAARTLRYEFLERTAARMKATRIATGHTMTDQAETLIMRLMRGTGLTGLGGILSVAEGMLVRPLLELEREEIEAYLDERRIACRRDETNEDLRFLRNRIRLELLPVLRTKFEPRLVQHLGRLALLFQDEERVMERVTAEAAAGIVGRHEDRLELDAEKLRTLDRGLARRVVRFFLREIQGDLRGLTFDDVEDILNLGEGREKTIRKALAIRRETGRLFAKTEQAGPRARAFSYTWDGTGVLEVPEAGVKVHVQKLRPGTRLFFDDRKRAYVDARTVAWPLEVRSRRPGDIFRPLGAPGRGKLNEMFRAKRIPQEARDRRPIFISAGKIVWVPGLPVSHIHRVTALTKSILALELL